MIRDLSESLWAMLDDPALAVRFKELAAAQVVFEPPTEQFKPAQTTLDLFLYDVREDMELRTSEPVVERPTGKAVIRRAPLRVACTYLVTAWPVGGAELALQEHHLLGQALQLLSEHATIPAAYLRGGLVGQEPPMLAAKPDGMKDPADFWTALRNRPRPSFNVKVTVSMQYPAPAPVGVVTTALVRLGEREPDADTGLSDATRTESFRIAGRVTNAAGAPVAGAVVKLSPLRLTTATDTQGVYTFGGVRPGDYTVLVNAGPLSASASFNVPAAAASDFNVVLQG
jgi:hypothetical protein